MPSYRIPSGLNPMHNGPWNCIMFDLKGPLSVVNDTFKLKNSKNDTKSNRKNNENLSSIERVKMYIISFADCLTRAIILNYVDRKSYLSVKQAFVRFNNTCDKPSLCISDADSSSKAISRDNKLAEVELINKFVYQFNFC